MVDFKKDHASIERIERTLRQLGGSFTLSVVEKPNE